MAQLVSDLSERCAALDGMAGMSMPKPMRRDGAVDAGRARELLLDHKSTERIKRAGDANVERSNGLKRPKRARARSADLARALASIASVFREVDYDFRELALSGPA